MKSKEIVKFFRQSLDRARQQVSSAEAAVSLARKEFEQAVAEEKEAALAIQRGSSMTNNEVNNNDPYENEFEPSQDRMDPSRDFPQKGGCSSLIPLAAFFLLALQCLL